MFKALSFKIHTITLYEECQTKLKMLYHDYKNFKPYGKQKQDIEEYLTFLAKLVAHNVDFVSIKQHELVIALLQITLKKEVKR